MGPAYSYRWTTHFFFLQLISVKKGCLVGNGDMFILVLNCAHVTLSVQNTWRDFITRGGCVWRDLGPFTKLSGVRTNVMLFSTIYCSSYTIYFWLKLVINKVTWKWCFQISVLFLKIKRGYSWNVPFSSARPWGVSRLCLTDSSRRAEPLAGGL